MVTVGGKDKNNKIGNYAKPRRASATALLPKGMESDTTSGPGETRRQRVRCIPRAPCVKQRGVKDVHTTRETVQRTAKAAGREGRMEATHTDDIITEPLAREQ